MPDRFPGPYKNSVPQDLNNPDPMVERVPVTKTDIGSRKAGMPGSIKNSNTIRHVGDMHGKGR